MCRPVGAEELMNEDIKRAHGENRSRLLWPKTVQTLESKQKEAGHPNASVQMVTSKYTTTKTKP